ncbi:MAG: serine/threonine-protein kinase [Myxococcota bacterium]
MHTPPHSPTWSTTLAAGTVLGGRYRLAGELGHGGMGCVYEATNVFLGKRVAVKVLDAGLAQDAVAVARFVREARAASSIEHRNVVQILDYGEGPGLAYYVMERLDGVDLERLLGEGGRLPWPHAQEILLQAARGLRAAHEAGIVHCDVKPSNIFVVDRRADEAHDRVKVLDFGIARTSPSMSTQDGTSLLGTTSYMAPEQALGAAPDARTDVYAMGVLMYRVLTGRVPFAARDPHRVLAAHASEQPPLLREWAADVPASVEAIVLQCLAKSPQLRLQSMRALELALAAIGDARPTAAAPIRRGPLGMSTPLMAARIAPTQELGDWLARREPTRGRTQKQTSPVRRDRKDPWFAIALLTGVVLTVALGAWFAIALTQRKDDHGRSGTAAPQAKAAVEDSDAGPEYGGGPKMPGEDADRAEELRLPFGVTIPRRANPPEPEPPPTVAPTPKPKSKPKAKKRRPSKRRGAAKKWPHRKPRPKVKRKPKPKVKPRPKVKRKPKPKVTRKPAFKLPPKAPRPYSPKHDAAVVNTLIADAIRTCKCTEKAAVLVVIGPTGRVSRVHHKTDNAETICLAHLAVRARFSRGSLRTRPLAFQAKP